MTFETSVYITLKEYLITYLKLFYRKPGTWIILAAGVMGAAFLITKTITIDDGLSYYAEWFLIVMNILFPVMNLAVAQKHYRSSKAMQQPRQYIFDDEKITYKGDGMEGYLEWKYITKYKQIKNFIFLHMASKQAIFVKSTGLTAEQTAFIKSKIKTTK